MGQKINPYGFRLGVSTDWKSRWFSDREYKQYLTEDWQIRDSVMERLETAAISRIESERTSTASGRAGTHADQCEKCVFGTPLVKQCLHIVWGARCVPVQLR